MMKEWTFKEWIAKEWTSKEWESMTPVCLQNARVTAFAAPSVLTTTMSMILLRI